MSRNERCLSRHTRRKSFSSQQLLGCFVIAAVRIGKSRHRLPQNFFKLNFALANFKMLYALVVSRQENMIYGVRTYCKEWICTNLLQLITLHGCTGFDF